MGFEIRLTYFEIKHTLSIGFEYSNRMKRFPEHYASRESFLFPLTKHCKICYNNFYSKALTQPDQEGL